MRYLVLSALLLAAAWGAGQAQPPDNKKDPQAKFEPRGEPGEGQKFLLKFAGDWQVEKSFFPRDGGTPARSKGECKQTMIHDGRFLQSDFVFGVDTNKTTGMGLIGFESATGKFTSVWTDSRQTKMSFRQGKDKFDGEQIVLFGQVLGEEKDGRRSKTITRLEDHDNKIIHRQYAESDGQSRLVMELVMTRKKPNAPDSKAK